MTAKQAIPLSAGHAQTLFGGNSGWQERERNSHAREQQDGKRGASAMRGGEGEKLRLRSERSRLKVPMNKCWSAQIGHGEHRGHAAKR